MLDRLEKVKQRYDELTALLSDPRVVENQERFRALSKEHSDLTPLMKSYEVYRKVKQDLAGLKEITETSADAEMKQLAFEELGELKARIAAARARRGSDIASAKSRLVEARARLVADQQAKLEAQKATAEAEWNAFRAHAPATVR